MGRKEQRAIDNAVGFVDSALEKLDKILDLVDDAVFEAEYENQRVQGKIQKSGS